MIIKYNRRKKIPIVDDRGFYVPSIFAKVNEISEHGYYGDV